jgi:hypothetical protein
MRRWLRDFVRDESGFVSGPEWAFLATILVLGAITAIVANRHVQGQDDHPPAMLRAK